jgi:flagellar basal body-associated protein FliL
MSYVFTNTPLEWCILILAFAILLIVGPVIAMRVFSPMPPPHSRYVNRAFRNSYTIREIIQQWSREEFVCNVYFSILICTIIVCGVLDGNGWFDS